MGHQFLSRSLRTRRHEILYLHQSRMSCIYRSVVLLDNLERIERIGNGGNITIRSKLVHAIALHIGRSQRIFLKHLFGNALQGNRLVGIGIHLLWRAAEDDFAVGLRLSERTEQLQFLLLCHVALRTEISLYLLVGLVLMAVADVLAFHNLLQQSLLVFIKRTKPIESTHIFLSGTLCKQLLASLLKMRTIDKTHVHLQTSCVIDGVRTVAFCQFHTCRDCLARIHIHGRSRSQQVFQHILHHLGFLYFTRHNLTTFLTDTQDGIGHKLVFAFHLLQGKLVGTRNLVNNLTHTIAVECFAHLVVQQRTDIVERQIEVVKQLHHGDGLTDAHSQFVASVHTYCLICSQDDFLG